MYGELQDEPPNLLVDENTAYPHVDKAFDLTYGLSDKLGSWWNQPSPPAWVDVIGMFDVEPIGSGRAYVLSVLKWRAAQLGVCFILRKVFRLHAVSYCTRADPRWLRKTLTLTALLLTGEIGFYWFFPTYSSGFDRLLTYRVGGVELAEAVLLRAVCAAADTYMIHGVLLPVLCWDENQFMATSGALILANFFYARWPAGKYYSRGATFLLGLSSYMFYYANGNLFAPLFAHTVSTALITYLWKAKGESDGESYLL